MGPNGLREVASEGAGERELREAGNTSSQSCRRDHKAVCQDILGFLPRKAETGVFYFLRRSCLGASSPTFFDHH